MVSFKEKNSFHFYIISFKRTYVNFSLANFKRVASYHQNDGNEQCTMNNEECYFL